MWYMMYDMWYTIYDIWYGMIWFEMVSTYSIHILYRKYGVNIYKLYIHIHM